MKRMASVLLATFLSASDARAEESASVPTFEQAVGPIFRAKCVRCHGPQTQKAELSLDAIDSVRKGSESGLVIVPGKPEASLLWEMVHDGHMPPEGSAPLSQQDLETIRRWIEAGAVSQGTREEDSALDQHDVIPILLLRCAVCHGRGRREGGLDLRTKSAMLAGGKSGPAIIPGRPGESLLLQKIRAGQMPPIAKLRDVSVERPSEAEVQLLERWIGQGAPAADIAPDVQATEPDPLVSDEDRNFWAFRPPATVPAPIARHGARAQNPIDPFVLEKLEQKGLTLAPQAGRLALMRRAHFDLVGLPPTPEEVVEHLADQRPDADERLLDRLLASPRYGERWGRYWLDAAGYADSEGKRSQDPIRPHAWRYRDYVIRAFNSDKRYDRFLLEQVAGDELADYESAPITPDVYDNLVATGFLRMAPDGTGSDVVNFVPERLEVIADEIDIFGSVVLGLTLKCARCHSHKYDPIPQRDYYRVAAIFKGAYDEHDWLKPSFVPEQTVAEAPGRVLPYVPEEERRPWREQSEAIDRQIEDLKKGKRSGDKEVAQRIKELESQRMPEPKIRALWDRGEPSPTYIYRRGDHLQPTRLVGPGVPSVLTDGRTPFVVESPRPGATSTGRRLALARWLTQPDHPLTGRVMANRIWKHHFGQGLVASLGNFGRSGTLPTHPELLDWLAREFVAGGWSIKGMHRRIMTSAVYRQSSAIAPSHEALDPDNQLYSRMPMRRMEAEVLHDTLLFAADRLDEARRFGPPEGVTVREDGLVTAVPRHGGWRRSIYVLQRRKEIPTILEAFDLPQMNPNCLERTDSNVASQALFLSNNAMIGELARSMAERIEREVGDLPAHQIQHAYLLALGRRPSQQETSVCSGALADLTRHWTERSESENLPEAATNALAGFCHTILNSAAFLYID